MSKEKPEGFPTEEAEKLIAQSEGDNATWGSSKLSPMQYMFWGWDARGIYGDSLRADPRFHRPIKDWSTEDLHLYIEACREARISLSKDNARLREEVNKAMELLESDPDSRLRRMFELFETRRDSDEKLKALARERIEIAKLLSEDPSPATVIALVARLQGIII